MSQVTGVKIMNPLVELQKFGQSFWYDNMRRSLITSGELARMIREDGLRGLTSNPTIFEKAISGSTDYDADLNKLVGQNKSAVEILEELMVADIRGAAGLLRPVYDSAEGRDGFASLEVSPKLAHSTEGTISEAVRLFAKLERPNVMIKIPATPAGIPAIEEVLARGINVNVTLMFSRDTYEKVVEAYLRGLERLSKSGKRVDRIASVASLFVSRVDTMVDKLLEQKGAPEDLLGKAGIANARLLYQRFREIFYGARFETLRKLGARPQRLLWASTSTKNPKYPDVLYAEALIGPETVDTMPDSTIVAFRDHGHAAQTLAQGVEEARRTVERLAQAGVDYDAVMQKLQDEGVKLFADSFDKLLEGLAAKREALLAGRSRRFMSLGSDTAAVQEALSRADREGYARRLWARDASLWKSDAATQQKISNRLGWLTCLEPMMDCAEHVRAFVEEARRDGFTDAVLLGMGGSSLCPEVCRQTFGVAPGYLDLKVLDTSDPSAIAAAEQAVDLRKTLFLVATKSGTTIESLSLYRYFWEKIPDGRNFVAITDAGTPLEELARQKRFRRVFLNPPDIGGRYSALSYFGLVPAALIGADIVNLLDRADVMAVASACCQPPVSNPGLELGVTLGVLAGKGRNKVTFLAAPEIAAFGDWVEQLIAESTGKEGRGLVPVVGEPVGPPEVYGVDRVFVHMFLENRNDGMADEIEALEKAGHPVIHLALRDVYDLGQEFFRWEVATAIAGAMLGIDAFDEPNVTESKWNTARLLDGYRKSGRLPSDQGAAPSELATLLNKTLPGDYIALMAYLPPTPENARRLGEARRKLRDRYRVATTLGYGPRFLHSTGQLHKGGPDQGVFVQITTVHPRDLDIPGEPFTFGTLQRAQALGDLEALRKRGRRVLHFEELDSLENAECGMRNAE